VVAWQLRSFARSAIHAFPKGPPKTEVRKEELKEGKPIPTEKQELTFRKYRLLPEILNVLEN